MLSVQIQHFLNLSQRISQSKFHKQTQTRSGPQNKKYAQKTCLKPNWTTTYFGKHVNVFKIFFFFFFFALLLTAFGIKLWAKCNDALIFLAQIVWIIINVPHWSLAQDIIAEVCQVLSFFNFITIWQTQYFQQRINQALKTWFLGGKKDIKGILNRFAVKHNILLSCQCIYFT